jgi:LacI family transcriptional regulator
LLRVPLTTVSWSRQEQGRRAAELLLERLDDRVERAPQRVIIPPRLVVRESCGARTAR